MGIKRSLCKVGICINKERFLLHNEDKCASQWIIATLDDSRMNQKIFNSTNNCMHVTDL